MLKVSLSDRNKLNLKFESDNYQLMHALKDYFTKKAPNYRFHPKFKAGIWNGDICLIEVGKREMPYGFLYDLLKFKKEFYKDEEFIFSEEVKALFHGEAFEIIEDLKWPPRDYQRDCIEGALKYKKGIIRCATAGGKCVKDIKVNVRIYE